MAEKTECAETKKIINQRVEIDTSPPFESVKEAVDRFGGGGSWIPLHLLRLAAFHHDNEPFDVEKMEEQALQLERDLMMKEQQTHHVLKELEAAKRLVRGFKVNLTPESSSFMATPNRNLVVPNESNVISPGLMLNQAKLNLNRTSIDLAAIQASLEYLNKKLRKDKVLLEGRTKVQLQNFGGEFSSDENHRRNRDSDKKVETGNNRDIVSLSNELKEVSFEAEQFKKITEASRYEVMKAMTEIERTKNSIKMAEMRLNAAKKMEEAAKAVEAIVIAGKRAFLINGEDSSDIIPRKNDGIMLSLEEYRTLAQKAKQAEEIEVPILEKFEDREGTHQKNVVFEGSRNNLAKFKFRNSHGGRRNPDALNGEKSCFRSTASIGDVLRRKLVVRDDVMVGRRAEDHSGRGHVSLSQMLREHSPLILHPNKPTGDGNVEKQYFFQRKKFGFIQVPVYTKQSKKKDRNSNVR